MTCNEFQEVARDYVRQEWMEEAARQSAEAHVVACATCQRRVLQERELEAAMAELRRERDAVAAPAGVQISVMAEFRARRNKRMIHDPRAWWTLAAAAVVAIAFLLMPARAPKREPLITESNGYATEFIPLRFGRAAEPNEMLQVIRIRLPARELTRLGVPLPPDLARSTVKADVLLGEDGVAKAIRFVN